jgi:hypothetical protein
MQSVIHGSNLKQFCARLNRESPKAAVFWGQCLVDGSRPEQRFGPRARHPKCARRDDAAVPLYKARMKRIIILAVVLTVIVVGWTAAWFYAAGLIRSNVVALASADGVSSPKLQCDKLDVGGYPFWFDLTCSGLVVTSDDLTATAPQLHAIALAYDPWHIDATATSPLMLGDAFTGSKQRLDWSKLEASAHLDGWRIGRISIIGDTLAFNDMQAGDVLIAKAKHAEFHLLDVPGEHGAAKGLASLANYTKLDDLNAPGFQINDGSATFDAKISGLPDDVRLYGDADMLPRWQAAGGKITLNGLKGADGASNFAVIGAVGLDGQSKPQGQLTIVSKGLVERFGSLVPEQYRALVLGNPDKDGNSTQVLNLTNGLIFSGVIPVGSLPPLM